MVPILIQKLFLSSGKYDPDPDFLPIPDPRNRDQKGTESRVRIRIRNLPNIGVGEKIQIVPTEESNVDNETMVVYKQRAQ
jgi:hypothetical protein